MVRIVSVACAIISLLAVSCPACRDGAAAATQDAGAASAEGRIPEHPRADEALQQDLKSLNTCCMALQDRWAAQGAPFIEASQRCTAAWKDVRDGRTTRREVLGELTRLVGASGVPPQCR